MPEGRTARTVLRLKGSTGETGCSSAIVEAGIRASESRRLSVVHEKESRRRRRVTIFMDDNLSHGFRDDECSTPRANNDVMIEL